MKLRHWLPIIAAKLTMACLQIATVRTNVAQAHSSPSGWPYPKTCCSDSGEECDPIPADKVRRKADGNYDAILDLKDHKNVPWDGMHYKVTPGQLRPSGDNLIHACIRKNGMQMDCLIIPFST